MKVENLEVLRDTHEGKEVEKTTFMGFEVIEINGYLIGVSKTVFVVLYTDINRVSAIDSCLKYADIIFQTPFIHKRILML